PPGRALIERHEFIARRGTACDMVVDTQVPAHSVYSFTEGGDVAFTDGDMELFDHPYDQIDFIRSAFSVITTPPLASEWREQHQRLTGLLGAAYLSNKERRKIHLSN
ncbi:MAG TPA: hypothetical protein VGS79_23240, partial [Puia sp.]|nr:hypothetical protein [Puia sp.]